MTRARDVADNQENLGGGVPPFVAGKNKIINGDFAINQRVFTSNTATGTYGFDRFKQANSGGTFTVTPQTFTLGTAPISGYEGKNFCRLVTASQSAAGDYAALEQMVESVRSFAGQTVTFSVWAKASTGTPKIGFSAIQYFGTGGSPSANVITSGGTATISTSWARYSFTIAVPSIAGKTIGSNNDDKVQIDLWTSAGTTISGAGYPAVGIQNVTIDTWGWQLEAGNVATSFTTASGSIAGELALCQRYYQKSYPIDVAPGAYFPGGYSLAIIQSNVPDGVYYNYQRLITRMRVAPTVVIYSGAGTLNKMTTVAGGDLANSSALTNSISDMGFGITNNSGTTLTFSSGGYLFYYTASAEL